MNVHQVEFIEMLKKHLAQEISIEQMYTWLGQNMIPFLHSEKAYQKPGMFLEEYACRMIRSHISDINDSSIQSNNETNLNWYWNEIERILDFLLGNKIYKTTTYISEYTLDNSIRKNDEWMLPHLEYAEKVFNIITQTKSPVIKTIRRPELASTFDNKPLTTLTTTEILMSEILEQIEYYQNQVNLSYLENPFGVSDIRFTQLNTVEKLIKCFKGGLIYSITVIFEGLNKFSIRLILS